MSRKTGLSHSLVFVLEVLQLDSFFLHFGGDGNFFFFNYSILLVSFSSY